jgi:protein O-GlcNAc transferase
VSRGLRRSRGPHRATQGPREPPGVSHRVARAVTHHQAGRLAEAERLYLEILRANPEHPDALHLLGVIEYQRGRPAAAVELIGRAIAADPRSAESHSNLGIALARLGRVEEAAASYQRALALDPRYPEAHNNLGNALLALGRPEEAQASYERALALRADYADACNNLGNALLAQGRPTEALAQYDRALGLDPRSAAAHNNRGRAFQALGQPDDALAGYDTALRLDPRYAEALNNRGATLVGKGQLEEAAASYRAALAIDPSLMDVYRNLGDVLMKAGRLEDGVATFERALAVRAEPGIVIRIATALPAIAASRESLAAFRQNFAANVAWLLRSGLTLADPLKEVAATPFYLAYQGLDDRELQEQLARFYRTACPALDWTAPHCSHPRAPRGRIRIGFVSAHLGRHTVGKLTRGLIGELSRDRFEVVVFHAGLPDPEAAAIAGTAARAVRLPRSIWRARRLIADAALDVVFYPDVGMEGLSYFLAFARLAPVQCVSWGHPVTTGIPTLDYFVSGVDLEPEDAQRHYTETLVRLEHPPTYYYRPRPSETSSPDRRRLGLPDGATLYVCPHSAFKLHPDFDEILGAILRRDSRGRIVLLAGASAHWTTLLTDRFRWSLPDVSARILVVPPLAFEDFLHLLRAGDILLDPIHFGGGNTTYEALALGLPIITWPGAFMRGRVTYALSRRLGVLDGVATGPDDYVERAVYLANDAAARGRIGARILEASDRIFETHGAVRELEDFLEGAVARAPATRGG